MAKLGGIYVSVSAKTDKFARDLKKAKGLSAKTAILMQKEFDSISFKQVGVAALAFAGVVAFAMKKSVDAASNLEETVGKFNVVFADQADQAEDMAKVLVDSYAMSTREAKQYLSSVQDLLVPMGMVSKEAIKMSNEVVKLSADLASFNNVPTATAMADIQSALVGNFETMKKYGVVLNETVIKQEALNQGVWDGKGMVDANTKAQIAFKLMLQGSAAALGDQKRTMGSYANQMKQLKANIEDIAATIGNGLLPQMTEWISSVNESIKQNPEIIKQLGEFAENILTLADTAGDIAMFGVEFYNVFTKISGAMGLASTGMISWRKALFDGADAVETFNSKFGPMKLRAEAIREELARLGDGFPFKGMYSDRTKKKMFAMINELETIEKTLARIQREQAQDLPLKPKIQEPPVGSPENPDELKITKVFGISDAEKKAIAEMDKIHKDARTEILLSDYEKNKERIRLEKETLDRMNEIHFAAKAEIIDNDYRNDQERLEITKQGNKEFEALGKTKFDLEREQIENLTAIRKKAGMDESRANALLAKRNIEIARAEQDAKLEIYKNIAGGVVDTFKTIAEAGGKHSKEAFAMYKAFAIAQATINVIQGVTKAIAQGGLFGIITGAAVAAAGAVQISQIANAQPPSYDVGGISNAKGVYQTGNIAEAHVPVPSGKIPVEINNKVKNNEKGTTQIIMNNPVFQDLDTQRQVMAQIANVIATKVAPGAVVQDYKNDGPVREMVRGGA